MDKNSSTCFRLSTVAWMPHILLNNDPKNPKVIGGTMLEVFRILGKHMGFCYRFQIPKDLSGGVKLENGSWNGVMGEITRAEADMTGLGLVISEERFRDIDISEFLYQDEWTASYIRPGIQSDVAGFVKPFTMTVWLLISATVFLFAITSYLVRLAYKNIHDIGFDNGSKKSSDGSSSSKLMNEAWLWTLASLLTQSIQRKVHGVPVRLTTGLWMLVCLTIASVYRSNLKSMLILPKITLPFDNLEQLADSDLPVWTPTGSVFSQVAKNSPKNTTFGRLYENFVGTDRPTDIGWAVRGLAKGEFVVAAPLSGLLQIIHTTYSRTGLCFSYIMSEGYMTTRQSFIFPKGSPLKAKFDPVILRLREAGILDHIYKQGALNATRCLQPISAQGSSALRPLDLKDFFGVFLIYAGGIVLALPSFIAEVLLRPKRQH